MQLRKKPANEKWIEQQFLSVGEKEGSLLKFCLHDAGSLVSK